MTPTAQSNQMYPAMYPYTGQTQGQGYPATASVMVQPQGQIMYQQSQRMPTPKQYLQNIQTPQLAAATATQQYGSTAPQQYLQNIQTPQLAAATAAQYPNQATQQYGSTAPQQYLQNIQTPQLAAATAAQYPNQATQQYGSTAPQQYLQNIQTPQLAAATAAQYPNQATRQYGSTAAPQQFQAVYYQANLDFTVSPDTPTSKVSIEWITQNLTELLNNFKCDNEKTFDWIEANIPDEITKENKFIRALMTSVCSSAISGSGNTARADPEVVKKWRALLSKYLDHSAVFELQALYALQALVNSLGHTSGLLRSFFDTLYDEEIIYEDAFNQWETSKEEQEGKGVALKQVVQFFAWLREGEEEEADR